MMLTVLDYDSLGKNGFLGCLEFKLDEYSGNLKILDRNFSLYLTTKKGQWLNERF